MKKLIFLLLAVMMLTACGQDKENDQGGGICEHHGRGS